MRSKVDNYVKPVIEVESYKDIYRFPEFSQAMNEYFDIDDTETRRVLLSVNEDDQSQILVALTSKLYDNIVEKVDDIDYGDIPMTKGDITKLPNYAKIVDCLTIISKILTEFKQDPEPANVVLTALANISNRKDTFEKAFKYGTELPIMFYTNVTLAIISATSLLISASIDFIKTPSEQTFSISVDKVGLMKSKQHLLYNNLRKFNKTCASGEFDKAMKFILDNRIKKLTEDCNIHESIGAAVVATTAAIGLILLILPILRECVYYAYYARTRVADYFELQANLIQMNAYNVEYNQTMDHDQRTTIANKQFKIADTFRKFANKIAITSKTGEVNASKKIIEEGKTKYKTTDLGSEMPDSAASSTSLF